MVPAGSHALLAPAVLSHSLDVLSLPSPSLPRPLLLRVLDWPSGTRDAHCWPPSVLSRATAAAVAVVCRTVAVASGGGAGEPLLTTAASAALCR